MSKKYKHFGAMKKIKDSGKYGQVNTTIVQYIL